jgi:hypothetical protein
MPGHVVIPERNIRDFNCKANKAFFTKTQLRLAEVASENTLRRPGPGGAAVAWRLWTSDRLSQPTRRPQTGSSRPPGDLLEMLRPYGFCSQNTTSPTGGSVCFAAAISGAPCQARRDG